MNLQQIIGKINLHFTRVNNCEHPQIRSSADPHFTGGRYELI